MSSIKALKEASVTGHAGLSHPWEVLWVCSSAITGYASYNIAMLSLTKLCGTPPSKFWIIVIESCLVWFPMVLAQSVYLYPYATIIMIAQGILVAIGMLKFSLVDRSGRRLSPTQKLNDFPPTKSNPTSMNQQSLRLNYLTLYRSAILYLTFIAILAVDFPALFPRRFCKTEEVGYGLMDVGAASFCISAGLVGSRRRNDGSSSSWKPVLHALPLVVIGIIRILTNQGLEYQEHITEYGVHWNFFFTLGVLSVVPATFRNKSSKPSFTLPLLVMVLYQLALSLMGWQVFVVNAPRKMEDLQEWSTTVASHAPHIDSIANGVLSLYSYIPTLSQYFLANREGVLGCCGYLSLYYFGEWVGFYFLWNKKDHDQGLGLLALYLWGLHLVLVHVFHVPVSRRSTNFGFCSWALAHNVALLYWLQLLENWIKPHVNNIHDSANTPIVPLISDRVNDHGLIMFLIANVLTGFVNLTVPTLEFGSLVALAIVSAYVCLIGLASIIIDNVYYCLATRKESSKHPESKKKP